MTRNKIILGILFGISFSTLAEDVTIKITGEIIVPPCSINGGQPIDIDFGSMSVADIDGTAHSESSNIPISCAYYQGTPFVKVTGSPLQGANDNVLATTTDNLGIALYQGSTMSTPLRLGNGPSNMGYAITTGLSSINSANTVFTMTAVPYKLNGASIAAGGFTATASMSISYM